MIYKTWGKNKSTSRQPDAGAIRAGMRIGQAAKAVYDGNLTLAAKKMRVSYWTLYRVARGDSAPTADFIAKAAKHFDIPIERLMR